MALLRTIALVLALVSATRADTASVIAGLASKDPMVRAEAEIELKGLAAEDKALVLERLGELPPEVALRVWRGLYDEAQRHAELLTRAIRSSKHAARRVWTERVGKDPSRMPLGCDSDLPLDVRAALVETQAGYGTWAQKSAKDPAPAIELLRHASPRVRWGLVNTLQVLEAGDAGRGIEQLLEDESPRVRAAALGAARGRLKGWGPILDLALAFLVDPSPLVRVEAARMLESAHQANVPDPRVLDALVPRLGDDDAEVRRVAARVVLRKRDIEHAAEAIVALLATGPSEMERLEKDVLGWADPRVAVDLATRLDQVPSGSLPGCLRLLDAFARRVKLPGPSMVPVPWGEARVACEPYAEGIELLSDGHERSFGPPSGLEIWGHLARGAIQPHGRFYEPDDGWMPSRPSTRWFRPPAPGWIEARAANGAPLRAVSLGLGAEAAFELLASEDGATFHTLGAFRGVQGASGSRWYPLPRGTSVVRIGFGPGWVVAGRTPVITEVQLCAGEEDLVDAWRRWAKGFRPWLEDGVAELIQAVASRPEGGRVDDALWDRLVRARAKHEGNPVLRILVPEQILRTTETREALAQLRQLAEDLPDYAPGRALLARVLVALKEYEAARPHVDAAITLDPADGEALLTRALIAREAGDHATAEGDLAVAVSLRPDLVALRFEHGYELLCLGRFDEGVATYRELVSIQVNHPIGQYNLACGLSRLKRYDEALRALDIAVACGFADADLARKDPDLEGIRSDPAFERILTRRPR